MPFRHATLAALLALLAPAQAQAQALSPAPLPGLWDVEWMMLVNGQDIGAATRQAMDEMLRSMPPAQRAQAEAMMKAQGGAPAFGGKQQECLTPAEVARMTDPRRLLADMQADSPECRFEPLKVSGASLSFKGRCTAADDGFTGDVTGEFTMASAKSWIGRWGGDGRLAGAGEMPGLTLPADGKVNFQAQGSGRWISSDCGSVRPEPR